MDQWLDLRWANVRVMILLGALVVTVIVTQFIPGGYRNAPSVFVGVMAVIAVVLWIDFGQVNLVESRSRAIATAVVILLAGIMWWLV